jgi:UDP-hydrolysing UDP-N-acetyl-D-glucosamine 2-epimerase
VRTVAVVTVARSDYGIYTPVLRRIQSHPGLSLQLIVSGMHLAPEFGRTVDAIEADGFPIAERVEMLIADDSPEAIAKSMGLGTSGIAQALARLRPDLVLVLGDRFEMHAAVVAAVPFNIPIAHIHGGEVTEGAIDDALRHSITKLSHLHFVATAQYARRVRQLGEEAWRITVSGAPALDHVGTVRLLSRDALAERFGLRLSAPPIVVTYHPVTREYEDTEWQTRELLEALAEVPLPIVFTLPNADTNGRVIIGLIEAFVAARSSAYLVPNLGTEAYLSLMACAAAMVGNSSSGLLEAPSFELPVVNIGRRQAGRVRAGNVIDVGYDRKDVADGLRRALDPGFRASLRGLRNPYGDGRASEIIVTRLAEVAIDRRLLVKRFIDAPADAEAGS